MELPLLRIGLLGFHAPDSQRAAAQIASAVPMASRWEVVAFEDADIWLLNSSKVTSVENRGLRIEQGTDPASNLTIYPQQTTRPVAFTQPVTAGINAVLSVQLDNPHDCARGLDTFAHAMPQCCKYFALGEQIAIRQSNLHDSSYHLTFEGRLIATVDFAAWKVTILTTAKPIELALASWRHREISSSAVAAGFESCAIDRLMWVYASRTAKPLLPLAYQTSPIYLRRLSSLPQSWLHHDHMNLISYLSKQSHSFEQLRILTQLLAPRLLACMSALYYSGTITVHPSQVQRNDKRVVSAPPNSQPQAMLGPALDAETMSSVFDSQPMALAAR